VQILIDSGSSSSFVNASLVPQLTNITAIPVSTSVMVAGGTQLSSSSMLLQVPWSVGNCEFQSDFRALPLGSFDVVVGMDWLSSYSPMQIHWQAKWMPIPYKGQWTVLQGLQPAYPAQVLLHIDTMECLSPTSVMSEPLPVPLQALLEEYSDLFQPPRSLPPSRACDHEISLIPGATPVFVRPYRYPPKLKVEIETQVQELLSQGLIRHSQSPFSSPVLLVRKKDGGYRFCVDFRHLNALTMKSKFLVPVFDQLMDELAHACWFTTLDLRAGFHQILLREGEQFKTAFQTHLGQYEFNVMAFGLTGAPGTFQGAMNVTLAPGLHKFVIVFFDDILIFSSTFESCGVISGS